MHYSGDRRKSEALLAKSELEAESRCFTAPQLALLKRWKRAAAINSETHAACSRRRLNQFYMLAMPGIMLPILNVVMLDSKIPYPAFMLKLAFMATSGSSALSALLNLSKLAEKHAHASMGYKEIVTMIDSEFAKPPSSRQPIAFLVQNVQLKLQFISESSPVLDVSPITSSAAKSTTTLSSSDAIDAAGAAPAANTKLPNSSIVLHRTLTKRKNRASTVRDSRHHTLDDAGTIYLFDDETSDLILEAVESSDGDRPRQGSDNSETSSNTSSFTSDGPVFSADISGNFKRAQQEQARRRAERQAREKGREQGAEKAEGAKKADGAKGTEEAAQLPV